jgi:hypothetical protein
MTPVRKSRTTDTMTYTEAQKLSLTLPWKIGTCPAGEKCWCRTITPVTPIPYIDDDGDPVAELYIAVGGELDRIYAEHIVSIHNASLTP